MGKLLCCGEAGEKEKGSARFPSSPARFLFLSIIDILMGIPSGSLCGGERVRSKKEREIPLSERLEQASGALVVDARVDGVSVCMSFYFFRVLCP